MNVPIFVAQQTAINASAMNTIVASQEDGCYHLSSEIPPEIVMGGCVIMVLTILAYVGAEWTGDFKRWRRERKRTPIYYSKRFK